MNYRHLERRIEWAIQDAIEMYGAESAAAENLRGIKNALNDGPLSVGDEVDSSNFSRRVNCLFGKRATVVLCWLDESTGTWWATVRDVSGYFETATAQWFPKAEVATA